MKNKIRQYIDDNEKSVFIQLGKVTNLNSIGEGGNGLVYQGELLGKEIALKFLTIIDSNTKLKRFKSEYFNSTLLEQKEGIVRYLDYDEILIEQKCIPVIIMKKYEYSFKKYRDSIVDKITLGEVINLFYFLIDSVGQLHEQGVIHRDLKPENILVDKENKFYVTDFGIAHFSHEEFAVFIKTNKKERLANYNFSAPEQLEGDSTPTFAMDVYAIGQICYWFLFGHTHRGTDIKKVASLLEEDNKTDLLDKVLEKCMRQNVSDRFQDCSEIKNYIEEYKEREKEPKPYEEMDKLYDIMTSVNPDCFYKPIYIEENHEIESFINHLNETDFKNRSLWFSYGIGNNYILNIKYLGNKMIVINDLELKVKKIWFTASSNLYDDLIIIETETIEEGNIQPFDIAGEKSYYAAIIDNKYIVSFYQAESGKVRINGSVVKTSETKTEYRSRYNNYKYYILGTNWHSSILPENDGIISELQNLEINENNIISIKKDLRKKKHPDVLINM